MKIRRIHASYHHRRLAVEAQRRRYNDKQRLLKLIQRAVDADPSFAPIAQTFLTGLEAYEAMCRSFRAQLYERIPQRVPLAITEPVALPDPVEEDIDMAQSIRDILAHQDPAGG